MNYNFYIIGPDILKLSSLKRILRREMHGADIGGSVSLRTGGAFLKSIRKFSDKDIYLVDLSMFLEEDLLSHLMDISQKSPLIVLLDEDYDGRMINRLIDQGLRKLLKVSDFTINLILEYISNDIEEAEIRHYLDNTNLRLSNDHELKTIKLKPCALDDGPLAHIESYDKSKSRDEGGDLKSKSNLIKKIRQAYKDKRDERSKLILDRRDSNKDYKISTAGKRHINIWGDYQFGCELAYMISQRTPLKVVLIDSNLLAPSIDMYFGIEKFSKAFQINDSKSYDTGLNIAIDAIRKNVLNKDLLYEIARPHKKNKNLYFICGSYDLNSYEYYDSNSYIKLIDACKDSFDLVISLSNESIYDLYTSISIIKSDINIVPTQLNFESLRRVNSQISFLADKQNICLKKNYLIPFEYMRGIDMSLEYLRDLSLCKGLSKISFSKKRRMKKSSKKSYVESLDKKQKSEYIKVIKELGYI